MLPDQESIDCTDSTEVNVGSDESSENSSDTLSSHATSPYPWQDILFHDSDSSPNITARNNSPAFDQESILLSHHVDSRTKISRTVFCVSDYKKNQKYILKIFEANSNDAFTAQEECMLHNIRTEVFFLKRFYPEYKKNIFIEQEMFSIELRMPYFQGVEICHLKNVSITLFFSLLSQLLDIVDELMSKEMVHLDIHGKNILFDQVRQQLTIIDFGQAARPNEVLFRYKGVSQSDYPHISRDRFFLNGDPETYMTDYRHDWYSVASLLHYLIARLDSTEVFPRSIDAIPQEIKTYYECRNNGDITFFKTKIGLVQLAVEAESKRLEAK